jgi:hypothetical protein
MNKHKGCYFCDLDDPFLSLALNEIGFDKQTGIPEATLYAVECECGCLGPWSLTESGAWSEWDDCFDD